MGRIFLEYLTGKRIFVCKECEAHLVEKADLISTSFHGRTGQAYLFQNVINLNYGPPKDKHMMTGLHTVRDIKCRQCSTEIGWTYVKAYEESQKYKEGKFIIEKAYFKKHKQQGGTTRQPYGMAAEVENDEEMSSDSEASDGSRQAQPSRIQVTTRQIMEAIRRANSVERPDENESERSGGGTNSPMSIFRVLLSLSRGREEQNQAQNADDISQPDNSDVENHTEQVAAANSGGQQQRAGRLSRVSAFMRNLIP